MRKSDKGLLFDGHKYYNYEKHLDIAENGCETGIHFKIKLVLAEMSIPKDF